MPTGPTAAVQGLHRGAQGTVRTELVCALGIHSDAPRLYAQGFMHFGFGTEPTTGRMLGFLLNLSREHLLELVPIMAKELPPGWWI